MGIEHGGLTKDDIEILLAQRLKTMPPPVQVFASGACRRTSIRPLRHSERSEESKFFGCF